MGDDAVQFRAPLTIGPYTAGRGELRFELVGGRTSITRALAVSPLKILNPVNAGSSAWAFLASYGGGLLGGDALSVDVVVQPGATALVATQASTKVYRSERVATQHLRARVAGDALLAWLPDPVTCFAGARYRQHQDLRIDPGANVVLVDRLTAGRVASGERWLFDEYSSRTEVWRNGRLLVHDGLHLRPEEGAIARRLDRFNCLATALLIGPSLAATAAHLTRAFASDPVVRRAALLRSAAPIDSDGVMIRMAGESIEQVGAAIREHLSQVTQLLGDDPWKRKY